MTIERSEARPTVGEPRTELERILARLLIHNKTVWVYLLSKLGYIERQEVEALGRELPPNIDCSKAKPSVVIRPVQGVV